MSDPLSVIAGIVGVAAAGLQCSKKLYDIYTTMSGAPEGLSMLSIEITLLSGIFHQLHTRLHGQAELYTPSLISNIEFGLYQFSVHQLRLLKVIDDCDRSMKRLRYFFKEREIQDIRLSLETVKSTMLVAINLLFLAQNSESFGEWPPARIADYSHEAIDYLKRSRVAIQAIDRSAHEEDAVPSEGTLVAYIGTSPETAATWSSQVLFDARSISSSEETLVDEPREVWDIVPYVPPSEVEPHVLLKGLGLQLPDNQPDNYSSQRLGEFERKLVVEGDSKARSIAGNEPRNLKLLPSNEVPTETICRLLIGWTQIGVDKSRVIQEKIRENIDPSEDTYLVELPKRHNASRAVIRQAVDDVENKSTLSFASRATSRSRYSTTVETDNEEDDSDMGAKNNTGNGKSQAKPRTALIKKIDSDSDTDRDEFITTNSSRPVFSKNVPKTVRWSVLSDGDHSDLDSGFPPDHLGKGDSVPWTARKTGSRLSETFRQSRSNTKGLEREWGSIYQAPISQTMARKKICGCILDVPSCNFYKGKGKTGIPLYAALASIRWEPIYIRGSKAGQTWYRGSVPFWQANFSEDYFSEWQLFCPEEPDMSYGDAEYLLLGKEWCDERAIQEHGFAYESCNGLYWSLDPTLLYDEVYQLVVDTAKARSMAQMKECLQKRNMPSAPHQPSLSLLQHQRPTISPPRSLVQLQLLPSALDSVESPSLQSRSDPHRLRSVLKNLHLAVAPKIAWFWPTIRLCVILYWTFFIGSVYVPATSMSVQVFSKISRAIVAGCRSSRNWVQHIIAPQDKETRSRRFSNTSSDSSTTATSRSGLEPYHLQDEPWSAMHMRKVLAHRRTENIELNNRRGWI